MRNKSQITNHKSLSVVLATKNEEENIGACLSSVKRIADEIIVVDEESTDGTRQIARKHGAKVYRVKHEPVFHKTKQKAIDTATGDWILQLDADERVTKKLAKEIRRVIEMDDIDIQTRRVDPRKAALFARHQVMVMRSERQSLKIQEDGEKVAFFIPRLNYFLGKPLRRAGVYPDAVIRLIKKGKARLPGKDVHEQMEIDGDVAWLFSDMEHHDSPTMARYFDRANRYTSLTAEQLKKKRVGKSYAQLLNYTFVKSTATFVKLYFRHLGILDGARGFLWSFLSALHWPLAYWKYYIEGYRELQG